MAKRLAPCVAVLSLMFLSSPSKADTLTTFAPPNTMRIMVGDVEAKGITEAGFNAVLDKVQKIYAPILKAKGANFVINRLWTDGTVNASAEQRGADWIINMYGGLARHHLVTLDGFALVACHELGHHLGGFPKYGGMDWASNEGQSDYFATLKCAHRILSGADAPSAVDPVAAKSCAEAYQKANDVNLCQKSVMGGISLAGLLAELGGTPTPNLSTPNPAVVDATEDGHPEAQCRLDTYYQGALCLKPYDEDLSPTSPTPGACTASQGFKQGLRALCWYKPGSGEAPQFNSAVAAMPDAKAIEAKVEAFKSAL